MAAVKCAEPAKSGSCRLFRYLYEQFFQMACDVAHYYCRNVPMAEDIAQDAFLKLWESLPGLQNKSKDWYAWRSYVFVLTRNRAYNLVRDSATRQNALDEHLSALDEAVIDDRIIEKELNRIFTKGVDKLAYQQKEIFVLKFYRFKSGVIAKEMNISASTVHNTLYNARKILRKHLNSEFEIDEIMVKRTNKAAG